MIGVVIDIETSNWYKENPITGTLEDSSEILEVGYIRVDMNNGKIIDCGELYFYKPYFQVESSAQEVHGIQRSFLEQYEGDFRKNLIILNSIIQRTCLIGKNSSKFDIPYITEFLRKHSGKQLDITRQVMYSNIKTYAGEYMSYNALEYSIDLQEVFAETFRNLYFQKYGVELSNRKKGKLEEYIDVLNMQAAVDTVYAQLPKKRVTRAHGALYDAAMTYIVWLYCKAHQLY